MIGQAIADGILGGAIISLGALGILLTLQILRFANFAHSELLTWGAYIALTMTHVMAAGDPIGPLSFGWQFVAAIAVAGLATAVLATVIDNWVFRRLRSRAASPLTLVFAAFGVALVVRNLVLLFWGPEAHHYSNELQIAVEILPGVRVLPDQIVVLGLALTLVIFMYVFLRYSRFGTAMRAMAESPSLAKACGVPVASIIRSTWIVVGLLSAAAGAFLGLTSQIRPDMGFNLLLSMFTAVILGGISSLSGAIVGGLIVGLAENLSALVISTGYKQAVSFAVLIAILFFRPQGLFGPKGKEASR
ncbi:MAG: branched-chain amino acid ABC transporter permease [Burkholderiaceae bacterium]|nr:branched-chain amino acid ABC transporter permease [Burkholderiaceae bacterium]